MHELRHKAMLETQDRIKLEFYRFKEFCNSSQFTLTDGSFSFVLLEKRIFSSTPLLKAYFTRLAFELQFGSCKNAKHEIVACQILPFISEVVMTTQYYHNQILDRKGGINNPQKVNESLLLSRLLEDALIYYIQEHDDLDEGHKVLLIKYIRKINQAVVLGQLVENVNNKYANFKSNNFKIELSNYFTTVSDLKVIDEVKSIILKIAPIVKSKELFLDWCLTRMFFSSAYIYQAILQLINETYGNEQGETNPDLLHNVGLYGMMMQIVNDVNDFVPESFVNDSSEKFATDAFSDLRNANVTLPLIFFLTLNSSQNSKINQYLEKYSDLSILTGNQFDILEEMILSRSISLSQEVGKMLSKSIKNNLTTVSEFIFYLNDMSNIAYFNQGYKAINLIYHNIYALHEKKKWLSEFVGIKDIEGYEE